METNSLCSCARVGPILTSLRGSCKTNVFFREFIATPQSIIDIIETPRPLRKFMVLRDWNLTITRFYTICGVAIHATDRPISFFWNLYIYFQKIFTDIRLATDTDISKFV